MLRRKRLVDAPMYLYNLRFDSLSETAVWGGGSSQTQCSPPLIQTHPERVDVKDSESASGRQNSALDGRIGKKEQSARTL